MLYPLVESKEEYCEPIICDSGSFKWPTVPWFFPALGFPRKNLGVDVFDYLHYIVDCLIL